ncbi:hypothetical protein EWM63_27855 [Pseudoduganella lutea]|uniref:Uncharacterized protein n=1 Tax=Pseudoduganella lutea TaxID=321985 RepID=A0A4P6L414_9BURK|nr:hypothetical protein EWM63_27855 [Pseudoduganella lutea]
MQALAQTGLGVSPAPHDAERYQELLQLGQRMLHHLIGMPLPVLQQEAARQTRYATPKIDLYAVIFRGADAILMVREKADGGRWSLLGVGPTSAIPRLRCNRTACWLTPTGTRLLRGWRAPVQLERVLYRISHPPLAPWPPVEITFTWRLSEEVLVGHIVDRQEFLWP